MCTLGVDAYVAETRGMYFRGMCTAVGKKYDGLAVVARAAKRAGLIDNKLVKKMINIGIAF